MVSVIGRTLFNSTGGITMQYVYNDGGREAAGFKGKTGDCAVRAIAIASGIEYKTIYRALYQFGGNSPRNGVSRKVMRAYMEALGWDWVPCMKIGTGCQVHLTAPELPMGRLVVSCSRHFVAVLDRVIHDTYNPSRSGTRCVYGYWVKK